MNRDPEFMASLKAQGFEESSSKSKLEYTFGGGGRMSPTKSNNVVLSSPTKNAAEPRPSSPHKPHPLQFVSPAISKAAAASGSSPIKTSPVKQVAARCVSPSKPHPLQFVSPQRSNLQANKVSLITKTNLIDRSLFIYSKHRLISPLWASKKWVYYPYAAKLGRWRDHCNYSLAQVLKLGLIADVWYIITGVSHSLKFRIQAFWAY